MANGQSPDSPTGRPPDFKVEIEEYFRSVGEDLWAGWDKLNMFQKAARAFEVAIREVVKWLAKFLLGIASPFAIGITRGIVEGEKTLDPAMGRLAATAVSDLFGIEVNEGDFSSGRQRGKDSGPAAAIGAAVLSAVSNGSLDGGRRTLEPSLDPAKAYLGTMASLALEGWYEGWLIEAMSFGQLEQFGELDDILTEVLGLGRMSRRVMGPIADALVITPARWAVNRQFTPELLSPAELARQVARGRMTRELALEEMARQGWSEERAEALLSNAAKRLSVDQLLFLNQRGMLSDPDLAARVRDHGYDAAAVPELLAIERTQLIDRWNGPIVDAAVAAYVKREIEDAELERVVNGAMTNHQEAQFVITSARTRRGYNRRRLSAAEARRLARAEILAVPDYRRALRQEGYDEFAVAALELELMTELQAERDLDKARAEQAAQRAAEKAERDAEREARDVELKTKRARAYSSLSEARRLYVRGYVALDRYREALEAEALPNLDVAAYLADAEQDRADYLETLERQKALAARETDAVVPIGVIEQAVIRGVLSLVDYERELRARGFDDAETLTLRNLLADKLEDQAEARTRRDEAEARAALQHVSLGTFERAVRLGVRTRDQYAAFLAEIGTAPPAAALILDLLDAQLTRDAEARAAKDQAAAAASRKGLSLEQRARAVRNGLRPIAYYAAALAESDIPLEDQQVLVELLEAEAIAAAEARARRADVAGELEDAALPLATIERAVKLGALPPAALRDRALARGLSTADADLLVQLVVADIPATRQGQRRELQIAEELRARNRSLADEKALVKRGLRTPADYIDWLTAQGYGADDAELLRALLEEEIAADLEGLRKRIAATLEKEDGAPPIDAFAASLTAGELDVPQFVEALASWNVARDSALVFGRLLLVIEPSNQGGV